MVGETPNIDRIGNEGAIFMDYVAMQSCTSGRGGALGAPSTAYIYDWNILPLGQQLWEEELESYVAFPPLQAPESYNLSGILAQIKAQHSGHPSD
jgi:arylsulfatase